MKTLSRATATVFAALTMALSGCVTDPDTGKFLMHTDPGHYSLAPAATLHLRSPQLLTVANGYPAKVLVPTRSPMVDADLKTLTETAVIMLGRAFQGRGIGVVPDSPKTVTLRITNVSLSGAAALPTAWIALEAQFGDGTGSSIGVENRGMRAVDGAILFALNALVIDVAFVTYMNR